VKFFETQCIYNYCSTAQHGPFSTVTPGKARSPKVNFCKLLSRE